MMKEASVRVLRRLRLASVVLAMLATAQSGVAQQIPGRFDSTFNEGGIGANGIVKPACVYPDGRILIQGQFGSYNGVPRYGLARLQADGRLDESFDIGSSLNGPDIVGAAPVAGNKIMIYGTFSTVQETVRPALARLSDNGTLDGTFNANFAYFYPGTRVDRVQPLADGKLLIVGYFKLPNESAPRRLARLNVDGTPDLSFNASISESGNLVLLAVQPDGKILIGGTSQETQSGYRNFYRLNRDGSIDRSFVAFQRNGAPAEVNAAAVLPDGKIIVGGSQFVRRIDATGAEDNAFQAGAIGAYSYPSAIVVQPNGQILIGGRIYGSVLEPEIGYARLNADGSVDTGFDVGAGTTYSTDGLFLLPSSDILIGGRQVGNLLKVIGGEPAAPGTGVARLGAATYLVGEDQAVVAIAIVRENGNSEELTVNYSTAPGTATPGDDFNTTSGFVNFHPGEDTKIIQVPLVRGKVPEETESFTFNISVAGADVGSATVKILDDDGTGLVGWTTSAVRVSEAESKALLSVTRTGETNGPVLVAFAAADGTALVGEDYAASSGVISFADGENQKSIEILLVGDNSREGSVSFTVTLSSPTNSAVLGERASVVVTIADDEGPGSVLHSYTAGVASIGSGFASATAVELPNGKIMVAGKFDTYAGVASRSMVRLNANGTVDESFVSPLAADALVGKMLALPDGKLLVRGLNLITGTTRRTDLIRLDVNGLVDSSFDPGAFTGQISALALQPDGKILVGGYFNSFAGGSRKNLARLLPSGALDQTFEATDAAPDPAEIVAQPDGRILVAGSFSSFAGVSRAGLTRLHSRGENDPGFVTDPSLRQDSCSVSSIALVPDGGILVGGYLPTRTASGTAILLKLKANGLIDPDFQIATRAEGTSDQVSEIMVQGDGRIVVGGQFTTIAELARNGLARLFAEGTGDASFEVGAATFPQALLASGDLLTLSRINQDLRLDVLIGGSLDSAGGGTVGFTWTQAAVSEGAGEAVLHLSRTGGNLAPVLVSFATANGSAIAGTDYVPTAGTVPFAEREITKTVRIPVIENATPNGPRTFTVTLSAPTGGAVIGSNASAAVTIADNERPGYLQFSAATYVTRETTPSLSVTVKRMFGDEGEVGAVLAAMNGTAVAGQDFQQPTTAIVFPPGVTEQTVLFPLIRDGQSEGDETLSISLQNPTGGAVLADGGPTSAEVRVIDVDNPGSLDERFMPAFPVGTVVRAAELLPDGKILVAYSSGPVHGLKRFLLNGQPDTEFPATTFDNLPLAMALQPDGSIYVGGAFTKVNDVSRARLVRLKSDGTLDDTFIPPPFSANSQVLVIGLQSDGKLVIGGAFATVAGQPQRCLARLNSNGGFDEGYRPTVAASQSSVSEMLVTPDDKVIYLEQQFRIRRLLPDGTLDSSFFVFFDGGGATVDCMRLDNRGRLLIGGTFSSVGFTARKNLARLLSNGKTDASFNPGDLFTSRPEAIAVQADGRVLVGGFSFGASRQTVIRVFEDGSHDQAFGQETVPDGNHLNGLTILPNGTVLVYGSVKVLDGIPSNGIGRLLLGPQPGALRFKQSALAATEKGTSAVVEVERFGGSDGAIAATFSTQAGSAVAGSDFVTTAGTVEFASGVTMQTITIPLVNDTQWEPEESFSITLAPAGGTILAQDGGTGTVIIADDDPFLAGSIQFAQSNVGVDEGAATLTLTVERVGGSDGETEVQFATSGGEALAGLDFVAASGTLTFAHGETDKEIQVQILNNRLQESAKSFAVNLVSISGAPVSGASATVTITDADTTTLEAFRGTYRGLISRDGALDGAVAVTVSKRGAFTGSILIEGRRYSFRGRFDADGLATITAPVKNGEPITLRLQIDQPGSAAGLLVGEIDIDGISHDLFADRSPYTMKAAPAPMAGRYTGLLEPNPNSEATAPRGSGYMSVTVAKDGTVRLVGSLADGSRLSQVTNVAEDQSTAFFQPLAGSGGLAGRFQFEGTNQSWEFTGNAEWVKSARATDAYFPAGFATSVTIAGSALPPKGQPLFGFAAGEFTLVDGVLSVVSDVTIADDRLIVPERPDRLRITVSPQTGLLSGSVIVEGAKKPVKFKGALLPNQNRAAGYFLGPNGIGEIHLTSGVLD